MSSTPQTLQSEEDLEECVVCRRHFAPSRIEIHESICKKSPTGITRKPYDVEEDFKNLVIEQEKNIGTATRILITNWRNRRKELLKQIKGKKNCETGKEAIKEFNLDDGACYDTKIGKMKVQNISGLCRANN